MTPDPANIYCGAGEVKFDRFDAAGLSTGLRHLGNTPKLELTPTVTVIEKMSAMSGARGTYKRVITGTKAEVAISMDEFDPNNLALVLLGKVLSFAQAAEAAIVDRDIADGEPLVAGVYYDLGGLGAIVTSVKQGVITVDPAAYTVDAESGSIMFNTTFVGANAFVPGVGTWSGSVPAVVAKTRVEGLSVGSIAGHLQFKSAIDQAAGPRLLIDIWNLDVIPDGAVAFLSDNFGDLSLKGTALQDTTRPFGEQYFRVIYL